MPTAPTLVWFRKDLRLRDNPALHAAAHRGGPVIPVYIWAPDEEGKWPPGGASKWWLHHSLKALGASLEEHGSKLILRSGASADVLSELAAKTGADAVYWSAEYEPAVRERDAKVAAALERQGIRACGFPGRLLFDPDEVRTKEGGAFQVYAPFWRACLASGDPPRPHAIPSHLTAPEHWPRTERLDSFELNPRIRWDAGLEETWEPGEEGAKKHMRSLLKGLADYPESRERPDQEGSSRLSPHLHHGEISVRDIWHAVRKYAREDDHPHAARSAEKFLKELTWRDFSHHLLVHFPETPEKCLRERYEAFPWEKDAKALKAWQKGQTGYPIVDAGLRQLWTTGWMHNRVRMVVGSFLVKDLLLPWHDGAEWFWDTLVDADLGNNTLNWQWVAGCGADAAPYFRIFNPVTQGEKFDPEGAYVRQWVPELAELPNSLIHKPWTAGPMELLEAGVELGKTYPCPIVDHAEARERALAALRSIRTD